MSITPNLMLKIRDQSAQLVQNRTTSLEADQDAIAAAATHVTDQVAGIIAATIADGGSYAEIMPILENRDFACPGWKDHLFSKSPKPSWLKGAAAAVYAWCEESGLQPFLAPYRGLNHCESRIVIQWDAAHIQACLSSDTSASFVDKLRGVSADARGRLAAERARERVKLVRKTIAEMHAEIRRVIKDGRTEVLVTTCYSGHKDPIMRGDSWTGDLIAYCEGLGLTVRVKTTEDHTCTWPEDTWRSDIFASWKAGSAPGN